ncbi:hypothetical protein D3C75_1089720 [compost metagenome]
MLGMPLAQQGEALLDIQVQGPQLLGRQQPLRLVRHGVMAQLVVEQDAGQRPALLAEQQCGSLVGQCALLAGKGGVRRLAQIALVDQQLPHQQRILPPAHRGQAF